MVASNLGTSAAVTIDGVAITGAAAKAVELLAAVQPKKRLNVYMADDALSGNPVRRIGETFRDHAPFGLGRVSFGCLRPGALRADRFFERICDR